MDSSILICQMCHNKFEIQSWQKKEILETYTIIFKKAKPLIVACTKCNGIACEKGHEEIIGKNLSEKKDTSLYALLSSKSI